MLIIEDPNVHTNSYKYYKNILLFVMLHRA